MDREGMDREWIVTGWIERVIEREWMDREGMDCGRQALLVILSPPS